MNVCADSIRVNYVKSDNFWFQGTRAEAYEHAKKYGYEVVKERNGNFLLTRSTTVLVSLEYKGTFFGTFDMKDAIVKHYKRDKISENLVNRFINEFCEGKVRISISENRYSIL